jgi:hypothetical protein
VIIQLVRSPRNLPALTLCALGAEWVTGLIKRELIKLVVDDVFGRNRHRDIGMDVELVGDIHPATDKDPR